jgi:hypothetical protein
MDGKPVWTARLGADRNVRRFRFSATARKTGLGFLRVAPIPIEDFSYPPSVLHGDEP